MPKTLCRSLWIFVLLVVAVISRQWLDDEGTAMVIETDPIVLATHQADYYLEDFHILNVDTEHGQVYELTGVTLSHHAELGNSTIIRPSVQVFSKNKEYWKGNALSGDLSADFKVLTLSGEVDLSQHQNDITAPIRVNTEAVTIDTDALTMIADSPVKISSRSWTFDANHMQADVETGILTFDTGVEAQYDVE